MDAPTPLLNASKTSAIRRDLERRLGPLPKAKKYYIIFMTPRSGSNLLCADLRRFGFGSPDETFYRNPKTTKRIHGWETDDFYQHLRLALEYGTVNDIYGLKISWYQFRTFIAKARDLLGKDAQDLNDAEVLDVFFPNAHLIALRRRDKIAQAVSYAKGIQTGVWRVPKNLKVSLYRYTAPPIYHQPLIEACFDELVVADTLWMDFLHRHRLPYLEVWYEDLAENYVDTMLRVYDYLALTPPEQPQPRLKKLANAQSQAWMQRFREETEWLHEPQMQKALQESDFHQVQLLRFERLADERRELAWTRSWGYRTRKARRWIYRIYRKAQELRGKQPTTD